MPKRKKQPQLNPEHKVAFNGVENICGAAKECLAKLCCNQAGCHPCHPKITLDSLSAEPPYEIWQWTRPTANGKGQPNPN